MTIHICGKVSFFEYKHMAFQYMVFVFVGVPMLRHGKIELNNKWSRFNFTKNAARFYFSAFSVDSRYAYNVIDALDIGAIL